MPRLNLTEDETRSLILDEAGRLFAEIGYDKTTVADIAKACGFSSANVHRVFGTKNAINRAAAERKMTLNLEQAQRAVDSEKTAAGKLKAFVRTVHERTIVTFLEHKRVHDMVACAVDERWEEVTNYRAKLQAMAEQIITFGCNSGEFSAPDPQTASRAFHTSVVRFFHPLIVAEMTDAEDGTDIEAWLSFMLRALGAAESDNNIQ